MKYIVRKFYRIKKVTFMLLTVRIHMSLLRDRFEKHTVLLPRLFPVALVLTKYESNVSIPF